MHTKKIIALGVLIALTAAQCWGANTDKRLIDAVTIRDIVKIQKLLAAQAINPDAKDDSAKTALMWAAMIGNGQILQMLLDAKFPINTIDWSGRTALMLAAVYGHNQTVQKLLYHGARVDMQDAKGHTALDFAIQNGDTQTVNILANWGPNMRFDQKQQVIATSTSNIVPMDGVEVAQACPVCFDAPATLKLKCGHSACQLCFKTMIAENEKNLEACPMCRTPFTETDIQNILEQ